MTITDAELARLLVALGLLLGSATVFGHLFAKLRQPPVIGEILGGLVLGPTLFGAVLPSWHDVVFPKAGVVPTVLGALYQLGLLLLMFASGAQMRGMIDRRSARTVGLVTAVGLVLPFLAGLGFVLVAGAGRFEGTAASEPALVLVFGTAVAVTSIPVIARIMHDLDLLETRFARTVLTVAILEDVAVYVVLAVALGLVGGTGGGFGLGHALGLSSPAASSAYHTASAIAFLAIGLLVAPRLSRRALRAKYNVVGRRSPIAFQLLWMFAFALAALLLGLVPIFGAFIAGVATSGDRHQGAKDARATISGFSFAFLVPVYFAIVGLRLDLLHDLDPAFFALFLVFACIAKAISVYVGARLAGERDGRARHLAVAMNARGGPGIVLASVSYDAGIIDRGLFATFVMLAIVTSLVAGWWLDRAADGIRAEEEPVAA